MDEKTPIGKAILDTSHVVKRFIDSRLSEQGVTGEQGRILGFIFHESQKKDVYQRDIEEAFRIRRSSVTSIVQLMEKNGYIIRVSVPEDARLKKLILTEKGLKNQLDAEASLQKLEGEIAGEFTEGEEILLKELLQKVFNYINKSEK